MTYKKELQLIKGAIKEVYTYYVTEVYSNDFNCRMYNVGVVVGKRKKEIENFSPDINEAIRLCDYLYNENVSLKNLFSIAEEFIVTL